jgi:hypothetical protein
MDQMMSQSIKIGGEERRPNVKWSLALLGVASLYCASALILAARRSGAHAINPRDLDAAASALRSFLLAVAPIAVASVLLWGERVFSERRWRFGIRVVAALGGAAVVLMLAGMPA